MRGEVSYMTRLVDRVVVNFPSKLVDDRYGVRIAHVMAPAAEGEFGEIYFYDPVTDNYGLASPPEVALGEYIGLLIYYYNTSAYSQDMAVSAVYIKPDGTEMDVTGWPPYDIYFSSKSPGVKYPSPHKTKSDQVGIWKADIGLWVKS